MKNEISEKIQNSNRPLGIVVGKATVRCFVPLAIVTATCAAFLPILWNDFVEWDDYETLVSNQNFRGLGWSQLGWMFTTFHMGHYQPLSWLTLAFDYSIWGMNPVGYHITNVLLHSANAVSLYFVTRQLLTLAVSESDGEIHENLARALAMQGNKAQAVEHFEAALRILKSPQPARQSRTENSR